MKRVSDYGWRLLLGVYEYCDGEFEKRGKNIHQLSEIQKEFNFYYIYAYFNKTTSIVNASEFYDKIVKRMESINVYTLWDHCKCFVRIFCGEYEQDKNIQCETIDEEEILYLIQLIVEKIKEEERNGLS